MLVGGFFVVGCHADEPPADAEVTSAPVDAQNSDTDLEDVADSEPEPEAPPPERRFLQVQGTVTMDGQAVEMGTEIPTTAEIKTEEDGYAVITLVRGGITEIRAKTVVQIGTSARKEISLKLVIGALWSFLPSSSSYEVETSNAVAGVRGTVFYTETRNGKASYICSCDGDVELQAQNPKSFKKVVKSSMEHKASIFRTRGKRQRVRRAKRLNHTDAQKDALLALMPQAG